VQSEESSGRNDEVERMKDEVIAPRGSPFILHPFDFILSSAPFDFILSFRIIVALPMK
jgi:hypothetical protein